MKTFLILFSVVSVLLVANIVYGTLAFVARDYDFKYIATHCDSLSQKQALNIQDHITYDRAIDGGLYIFDHVPNGTTPGDFKIAFRSVTTELLCFPIAGCIIPPHLSETCGA